MTHFTTLPPRHTSKDCTTYRCRLGSLWLLLLSIPLSIPSPHTHGYLSLALAKCPTPYAAPPLKMRAQSECGRALEHARGTQVSLWMAMPMVIFPASRRVLAQYLALVAPQSLQQLRRPASPSVRGRQPLPLSRRRVFQARHQRNQQAPCAGP